MKYSLLILITLTLSSWGEDEKILFRSPLISKVTADNADSKDIRFDVKTIESPTKNEVGLMLQIDLKSDLHKEMAQKVGIYLYDKTKGYIGKFALYRSEEAERLVWSGEKFKGTWYWCRIRPEYLMDSTLLVEYSSPKNKDHRWRYQLKIKTFIKAKVPSKKNIPNKPGLEQSAAPPTSP